MRNVKLGWLVVLATVLAVRLPGEEPAKAEPAKAEPAKAEPAKAEPAKAEPARTVLDLLKERAEAVKVEGGAVKVIVSEAVEAPAEAPVEAPAEAPAEAAKEAAAKEPSEKEPPAVPAEPPAPQVPVVRLRDQTRLAGKVGIETFHVATAYGALVIPVSEVLRVRFATARDTSVDGKVEELIKALGSDEFDLREEAVEKLREIGVPALELLRKAAESEDPEVKARAEKLVGELEELADEGEDDPDLAHQTPLKGEDDEVVTTKFTVMGRIAESEILLTSSYGELKLGRDHIISIVFRAPNKVSRSFTVPGATFAAANKWVQTDMDLVEGETIRMRASGTINLENFGQTTGPEGTTNVSGNQFQSFPTGALVARIGDKGQPFQVGAEFDGTANATGKLQLAISFQNGQVSGQFQVEVEKEVAP